MNCLDCGKNLDAASGINTDEPPDPGDISICFYCGHVMAYDEDFGFRPLTDEEERDIAGDEVIQAARAKAMK